MVLPQRDDGTDLGRLPKKDLTLYKEQMGDGIRRRGGRGTVKNKLIIKKERNILYWNDKRGSLRVF